MKRVILTLLVIFAATSIVHSQTILSGKVTDSSTGKAVEFASVSVKGKNSNFFDGATTDAQGYYTVGNLPNDTLSISVSCTGYEEHIKVIVCHGNNETINIDFAISNAVTNLGEVSVEAMRSQMRMELDKKVFDVSASTIAEGASVADILNDIPSVELTAEGTISLRGSESVIIWINGKPSGLDAENQTQILEQLPAESIERVEVITNPSSKYSPEGTAGIINIVLKEKRKAGYYGSIQAGINSRLGYNASGNIFYSNNKIDLFGSLGYSSRVMTSENITSRKTVAGGSDTGYLNSVGKTHKEEDTTSSQGSEERIISHRETIYRCRHSVCSASNVTIPMWNNHLTSANYLAATATHREQTKCSAATYRLATAILSATDRI